MWVLIGALGLLAILLILLWGLGIRGGKDDNQEKY